MISYIKGVISEKTEELIVLENNGIGYAIRIAVSIFDRLPALGNEVKIYTYMHVREDAMLLYGFLNKSELEVFRLMIAVSGVGPKSALGLLSILSPEDFRLAVISGDAKMIAKAPGIGAKSAQRIILDLKDKIDINEIFNADDGGETISVGLENVTAKSPLGDAIEALVSLGYSPSQASKAVRAAAITNDMDSEDILKSALKELVIK
jgi:Holliday junction DNA helicase, RuvA subunit